MGRVVNRSGAFGERLPVVRVQSIDATEFAQEGEGCVVDAANNGLMLRAERETKLAILQCMERQVEKIP